MLIHREKFAEGEYRQPSSGTRALFIYTDSSPSKGREVLGTVMDVFIGGSLLRTMTLPCTVLAHGYSSAYDKTSAVLLQLWLTCGPELTRVISVLSDIRCFCTDFGVESLLADMKNIFADWAWKQHRLRIDHPFLCGNYIFPLCVHIPDWSRLVSNCLQRSLATLMLWVPYLEKSCETCADFCV